MKKQSLFYLSYVYLLGAIIITMIALIYYSLPFYKTKFDINYLTYLYNHSQFSEKPQNRQLTIQDEDLYAYTGWNYLKTGEVNKINIEHPPLGKYLIGISIIIFNNQNIGQLIWALIFLGLLYKLSNLVLKNKSLSLLVVLFFIQEQLFFEQITHSLLDIILGVFLLIFLLASLQKKLKTTRWQIIEGLSLGAIASIKYPTIAGIAFFTLIIFNLLTKEKNILRHFITTGLLASFVFLCSYLPFFIKNPSAISFVNLQIKALKLWLSNVPEYPKFQVFNVLFLNRWLSWWGDKSYIKTNNWNIAWPILTTNFFIGLINIGNRKNLLIILWCLFYLLSLSLKLFFPRYLILLLPFLYISLCYNLKRLFLFLNHKL
jgi:predicted membrane-bound dolichyl-phosphate-mannose-protein mannosyltransferase